MSEDAFSSGPASRLFRPDINGVEILVELALDLRWSWNHCTDDIWRQLDTALWARTQNPWIVLQTVSRERLRSALADPRLCQDPRRPRAIGTARDGGASVVSHGSHGESAR